MIGDLAYTSIETITAFDMAGNYWFTVDELQNATIGQTQETVDITGKQGRIISRMKRNKTVTVSGTNGLISGGLLEAQTGSAFEDKNTDVLWTDYLTVVSNQAITSFKAIGTAGNEIEAVYVKASDGTLGTRLVQDSVASSGKFAYDPATKTLSFSGLDDNTEIVAYYKRRIAASVHTNQSDHYSGKAMLYVDAMAEDKCGNIFHVQFFIPKADFSGEFSIEMGDNPAVHSFEAESMAGGCSAGAAGALWTYTVFGANTEDVDPAPVLSGIAITTPPTTTSYSVGGTFSPTGMVVTASYSNADPAVLNAGAYTYAPNGALAATDTAIVVSYTEGGITKTASQAITVS